MPSESNVEQRREAQRAAARRRQANFRARERARGLEMVTLKVPASMRDALARLAACIRAEEPSEELLEESFAELRAEVAARRAGSPPPAPEPEPEALSGLPEEQAPQPWVDLAGLWKSSANVASLTDFSVMLADLDGTLYARWTARLQRADGTGSVDAYVRGTRSGPQDSRVTVDRMRLGGRTLQFQGVIAGPERMEGTLTVFTADDEATAYPAVFTRAG